MKRLRSKLYKLFLFLNRQKKDDLTRDEFLKLEAKPIRGQRQRCVRHDPRHWHRKGL